MLNRTLRHKVVLPWPEQSKLVCTYTVEVTYWSQHGVEVRKSLSPIVYMHLSSVRVFIAVQDAYIYKVG